MTCPCCLLPPIVSSTTFFLLLAGPAYASERCGLGPAGPRDREYLTQCRPEAVTVTEKQGVVATLPSHGAVTELRSAERTKTEALTAVLRFHDRDTVYEVRIIDVPQAWTGLHGRAVLLISRPVLNLLSAAELQAFVAHEIGHEYLWAASETAREADDNRRLRKIESACDAIAALTLKELGIPPSRLARAIEKVVAYNRARFGVAGNDRNYPSTKERRRLVAKFTAKRRQRVESIVPKTEGTSGSLDSAATCRGPE
jgi:Zn-dependent protease with chaperone function